MTFVRDTSNYTAMHGDGNKSFFTNLANAGLDFDNNTHWHNIFRYLIASEFIKACPNLKVNILEFGCSCGTFLRFCLFNRKIDKVVNYTGLEVLGHSVQEFQSRMAALDGSSVGGAIKLSSSRIIQHDFNLSPIPAEVSNQKYDLIYSNLFFEHVPETTLTYLLNASSHMLNDNGKIVITMPNPNTKAGKSLLRDGYTGHVKEYSFEELVSLMKGHGFELESGHGVFGYVDQTRNTNFEQHGLGWCFDVSMGYLHDPENSPYYVCAFRKEAK